MFCLPVYQQKWAAAAIKGFLVSTAGEHSPKHECDRSVSLLHSRNQNAANCRTEKRGKQPYPQLLGADLGFGLSVTISVRQGWQSPEVMPLSKKVGGQRVLGFYCFFSHGQNLETALMFGTLVPCLFSVKKIRKDEGVEGWEEGKQERKKSQKRGKNCVFK